MAVRIPQLRGWVKYPKELAMTFAIGQTVKMDGAKDSVVRDILLVNRKSSSKTMYIVEYTVDDELERANPTGRRYSQPRFGYELSA